MVSYIAEKQVSTNLKNNLYKDYPYFYTTLFTDVQNSLSEFFHKNFELKFIGISYDDNLVSYGDEFFANKIELIKSEGVTIKISSSLVSSILENTLGIAEHEFSLNSLTSIEGNLIKAFTMFVYKNIEKYINKGEVNKKVRNNAKEYNFNFFATYNGNHAGKIIISMPEYMINKEEVENKPEIFDISDFEDTVVGINIATGKTRVPLTDVKALEEGDIIVLEDSNINEMSVIWEGKNIPFPITPNPELIINIDTNGEDNMEEETRVNPQNMWDSILVDVVAEFDDVKLSLGELKQISEGLVIDVGSVYENKIKLRVENQVVATGELVILNDRYGVRIDKVKKTKAEDKKTEAPKKEQSEKPANAKGKPAQKPVPPQQKKPQAPKQAQKQNSSEGDENFDYSDFEIEDESI